ncbi:hypothetical protein QJQ45_025035, partial [Haematococcus lacustris]
PVTIKYELPGSKPPCFIDLLNDDDVANMWEAWQEHCGVASGASRGGAAQAYKLRLCVEQPDASGYGAEGGPDTGSLQPPAAPLHPPSPLFPPSPPMQGFTPLHSQGAQSRTSNQGYPQPGALGPHLSQQPPGPPAPAQYSSRNPPAPQIQAKQQQGGPGLCGQHGGGVAWATGAGAAAGAAAAAAGAGRGQGQGEGATGRGRAWEAGRGQLWGGVANPGNTAALHDNQSQICRFLGAGGYGEVYLCKWASVDVAVKSLSPSLLGHCPDGLGRSVSNDA